jgi:hypothetical protein
MNRISLFLIITAIFLLLIAIFWNCSKTNSDQDSIREKLAMKGLPTPAFASTKELENILKLAK